MEPIKPRKTFEQFQDRIGRLYPELAKVDDSGRKTLSRVVTFQVTDECNLACTYCYQINKGKRKMKFEDAKKLIDMLLTGDERLGGYITKENSPALIIEFIGGEPFLNIDLIEKISDYFVDRAIELCHPWATKFCFSICSNGVLYFDERVQRYLNKYKDNMSFSVTIDGSKELHDSCRVFPDGSPSYDLAIAAAEDWMRRGYYMGSKITIAPGNIKELSDSIINMVDLGYEEINANCVYEEGWTSEHATELYFQMRRIADYWIDHNIVETHYLSLFVENFFHPKDEDDLDNWCFRGDTMITTPEGERRIDTLRIGDLVKTADGSFQPLFNVMVRVSKEPLLLKVEGVPDTYTTKNHPYLAKKKKLEREMITYCDAKFIPAGELNPGDVVGIYVDTKKDDPILWVSVKEVITEGLEPYQVYNLTVRENPTFIANGLVVHNCGGTGYMLSMDPDGYLYPCIRYMESSLGNDREPLRIGHVDEGIGQTQCTMDCINCLNAVNRRTESTDECFYCPIAEGCSWCSAYNYQVFGTVDSRATYICEMHKARALANAYFWNSYYRKNNINKRFTIHCPEEWALAIIPEEEYRLLKELEVNE